MRDVMRQIASAGVARVFSLAATTVGLLLSARWLGPNGRGIVAVVCTWSIVLGTIAHLSLGQVALQKKSAGLLRDTGAALGTLLGFAIAVSIASWGVLAAMELWPQARHESIPRWAIVLGAMQIPFVVWEQYGSFLLMSDDRLRVYNRALVIGRSMELSLVVLLVGVLHVGVGGALTALLVGQGTVAVLGMRDLFARAIGRVRFDGALLKSLIKRGGQLHLSAIGALLTSYVDVLIVQRYLGTAETGWYQMSVQLVSVLLVVPTAASQVLYARMSATGPDGAWPQQRRAILGLLGALGLLACLGALLAPLAVSLVLGASFLPVVGVFRVLLLSVGGRAAGLLLAPQWIGRGLFWQASLATCLIGLFDVGLALILVPRFGMMGAAWASVGAYSIGALVNLVFAWRIDRASSQRARRSVTPAV